MFHRNCLAALFLVIALCACTEQVTPVFGDPVPFTVPSGKPAYGPRLTQSDTDGAILSWMETTEDATALRYSAFLLGDWLDAKTVILDSDMFVNWADLPAVTSVGADSLLAFWLSKTSGSPYSYQVLTAFSGDDGDTWSESTAPHTDNTPTEHGFVSSYAAVGGLGLVWLDGRNTPDNGMTLRGATVDWNGGLRDEALLDDLVCDCCQTAIAETAKGPVAAYRNRTTDEIRDIYISRRLEGAWQPGTPLFDDGWNISGCPVNGPAIDAQGERVVVAWFTAANDRAVVKTAVSTNSGKSFSVPVEVASKNVQGRVGIASIDRFGYVVSWMESDKAGSYAVKLRGMTFDGQSGRPETVGRTSVSRTVPQMLRVGDELIVAWTDEINDQSKVAAVRVSIVGFYD